MRFENNFSRIFQTYFPIESGTLIFAFFSTRSLINSRCPSLAARCKGVLKIDLRILQCSKYKDFRTYFPIYTVFTFGFESDLAKNILPARAASCKVVLKWILNYSYSAAHMKSFLKLIELHFWLIFRQKFDIWWLLGFPKYQNLCFWHFWRGKLQFLQNKRFQMV